MEEKVTYLYRTGGFDQEFTPTNGEKIIYSLGQDSVEDVLPIPLSILISLEKK